MEFDCLKKIPPEEVKQIELNLLKEITSFCDENNLKYTLDSGTLIGALRHKGFIPWDDDIDIGMYREDYERLKAAVINDRNERYGIFDKDTCDWYFQNFMVVVDKDTVIKNHVTRKPHDTSVFVDVFPIDRFNDTNWDVIVVPILAPKVMPTDCPNVIIPAFTNPTTMTVVAPLL